MIRMAIRIVPLCRPYPRRCALLGLAALLVAFSVGCEPTEGKDRSFQPAITTNADFTLRFAELGDFPVFVATGDLDGDLLLDAITANRFGNSVTILTGGLTVSQTLATGRDPTEVVIGDLDGLYDLDFAVLAGQSEVLTVYLSDGAGSWNAGQSVDLGGVSIQVALLDLEGDGDQDIVVSVGEIAEIQALVNDGLAGFTVVSTLTNNVPGRFVVGDWNLGTDSFADLAVLNRPLDLVTILLGDGRGGFDGPQATGIAVPDNPVDLAAFDYDGDGLTDLAVSSRGDDVISVLVGAPDGSFAIATSSTVTEIPGEIAVADLDNDGIVNDVASVHGAKRTISTLIRNQAATFDLTTVRVTRGAFGISAGLFDGDAFMDLAVVESRRRVVSILAGDGAGNFSRTVIGFISRPSFPLTVDLDGSGVADDLLLLQTASDRLVILENIH